MIFPSCSSDAVYRRYKLGVLGFLQHALRDGALSTDVLKASQERMADAVYEHLDNCMLALYTQAPLDVQQAAYSVAATMLRDVEHNVQYPRVIGKDQRLTGALNLSSDALDEDIVKGAYVQAVELLDAVNHPGSEIIRSSTLALLGLKNGFGDIRAFSDERLPGFIAFGASNPPGAVAEQLLHESVHTRLWSYLQLEHSTRDVLAALNGTYSPFVKRGRSALLVLHGLLSYGAVHSMWRAISDAGLASVAFGQEDAISVGLVEKRLAVLASRVRSAQKMLQNVCRHGEAQALAEAVGISWSLTGEKSVSARADSVEELLKLVTDSALGDITKAEIALAVLGEKVSRAVLPIDGLQFLEAFGNAGGKFVIGRQAIRSKSDDRIDGFSNIVSSVCSLDSNEPSLDVFVYFGKNIEVLEVAARLDDTNEAGLLLEIPACCQEYFRENWSTVMQGDGDLFGHLLAQQPLISTGCLECNATQMYRGKGLCWHFPCSLNCDATKTRVRRRLQLIHDVDEQLAFNLNADSSGILLWSSVDGYCYIENAKPDAPIPLTSKWLSGKLIPPSISSTEWVCGGGTAEIRRLVIFE